MNAPSDPVKARRLLIAIKALSIVPDFAVLMDWLGDELTKRDRDNRTIGKENQTSEAHALAVILDHVAACQNASEADGSENDSGADQESAAQPQHMTA